MNKLLLGGVLVLAISCLFASCANDEVDEVPMNEKKEVILTTRLDAVSRAVEQGQDLELFSLFIMLPMAPWSKRIQPVLRQFPLMVTPLLPWLFNWNKESLTMLLFGHNPKG